MGASADSWICDMVVDFNNEISLRSVGTPARRIFICCQKEESTLKLKVVPEKLRTLDHGRPWSDDQFASTRLSSSRDMSR